MKRKTIIQDVGIKYVPPAPDLIKSKHPTETANEVLAAIRQLEPEQQNDVIKMILAEIAVDRHNSVKSLNEAAAKARECMDVFMTYAMGIEKLLASAIEKPR